MVAKLYPKVWSAGCESHVGHDPLFDFLARVDNYNDPDVMQLSRDRWKIFNITEEGLKRHDGRMSARKIVSIYFLFVEIDIQSKSYICF